MIYTNRYDSFFGKQADEDGRITLNFDSYDSIEVYPFETEEGEILYEVSESSLSIYDVAQLCKCEVVLAHIKSGRIWEDNIEIIKRTPQTIETLYEVSSYGAYWHCKSNYIVFSSVEEIKMYYLKHSRKILSEINLILPNKLPFNSSQYLQKIDEIIEDKIINEWGKEPSFSGHYDSNFQYVMTPKSGLAQLNTYRNEKLYKLLRLLDNVESDLNFYRKELLLAKYILIGKSDVKSNDLELCPLSSECLDEYDSYPPYGESSHKCFLAMLPR